MHQDQQLVERAQSGDASAAGLLYESYFDKIYRYVALRVGDPAEAEDITEGVFLKMLEAIGSFRFTGAPFSSWLFRIAHNQVIDHHRRRGKRQAFSLDAAASVPGREDPVSTTETRLQFAQLGTALRGVTEAQRQVIALRFGAGLSIAEVARAMGKREGAIKALQHSAVQALRRALARQGSDLG
ncbi:MAG: sigma-70 family RNA polymerase sigma factor, partial [Chloroflexi bacterium]|nr:sigma-70 family RNA polymerase sigma factor [Chloroflexota bacterium]